MTRDPQPRTLAPVAVEHRLFVHPSIRRWSVVVIVVCICVSAPYRACDRPSSKCAATAATYGGEFLPPLNHRQKKNNFVFVCLCLVWGAYCDQK